MGADLPTMNARRARSFRQGSLSLTTIASRLAPTGHWGICKSQVGCMLDALCLREDPGLIADQSSADVPGCSSWLASDGGLAADLIADLSAIPLRELACQLLRV